MAIIDPADDLNVNAANAVLKTLEEPPPRGVIFIVSHSPGRLLPTIRSRCRRLLFRPLGLEATAAFVREHTSANPEEALRLARMSGEAPAVLLVEERPVKPAHHAARLAVVLVAAGALRRDPVALVEAVRVKG